MSLDTMDRIRTGWLTWEREGDVWTAHGPDEFVPAPIRIEKLSRGFQIWGTAQDGCWDSLAMAMSEVEGYVAFRILSEAEDHGEDHARAIALISEGEG